ncbi:MAG: pyridoxal-phosphate dependent enzyme, partial [Chloroflexi bacterium]|nr:pyridoxal-phosphate dependent enzyme [Chloroflexota bacterium]
MPFTSFLTTLRCAETGEAHDPTVLQSVSRGAGATLLPEYDLDAVRAAVTPENIRHRPHDLWRFRELLPLDSPHHAPDLGAGATPLLRLRRLGEHFGLTNLWLKDEGANPTGTFKARGA